MRTCADEVALVATLQELIAIPSIGGTPGEAEIQHHLAERLGDLGLTVDLWPIDLADLRAGADFPGEEVERTQAWGLVGTHRPEERSRPDPAGARRRGAARGPHPVDR